MPGRCVSWSRARSTARRCFATSRRASGRSICSRNCGSGTPRDNNGVLIYLLLADRDVEIIADRGIDAKVGAAGWGKICREMEADFASGQFESGAIKGIAAVSRQLATHFPPHPPARNELPDAPVVI